jgi:hypothetical protein
MNVDKLVEDVLSEAVPVETLNADQLEAVLGRLQEIAQNLLDTEHHDAADEILQVLAEVEFCQDTDMTCFADAIAEATARGSQYWQFDEYTIH